MPCPPVGVPTHHLPVISETLLKDAVDKDLSQCPRPILEQLCLAQHAIVVRVQVEVLTCDTQYHCNTEV